MGPLPVQNAVAPTVRRRLRKQEYLADGPFGRRVPRGLLQNPPPIKDHMDLMREWGYTRWLYHAVVLPVKAAENEYTDARSAKSATALGWSILP